MCIRDRASALLLFSALCLLAAGICLLCDFCLSGRLSWSLIVLLSDVYKRQLFPYLFRHGVEKARLYMMIFFVVLLALVAALAGLAGAALPQGSILFLLGAPAALVLARCV